MTHKAFVMLFAGNKPVSLSTGVQIFNRKGGVLGCNIHTRTVKSGGFDHPILLPGLGPKVSGWGKSLYHEPHLDAEKELSKIDGGKPVDFSELTTPNAFWRLDNKSGEFVIMDSHTRRMLRVSPLVDDLQGGFWRGIHLAYEQVRKTGTFTPGGVDDWFPKGDHRALFKDSVYVALNPAPYHAGQRTAWSFCGPKAVLFEHDIEAHPFSEEFEWVKHEEALSDKELAKDTPYVV